MRQQVESSLTNHQEEINYQQKIITKLFCLNNKLSLHKYGELLVEAQLDAAHQKNLYGLLEKHSFQFTVYRYYGYKKDNTRFTGIDAAWQLQALTGDIRYLQMHIDKGTSTHAMDFYAIAAGENAFKEVIRLKPSLLTKNTINHAYKLENIPLLKWFFEQYPEEYRNRNYPFSPGTVLENIAFFDQFFPEKIEEYLNNFKLLHDNAALMAYAQKQNRFPPPTETDSDLLKFNVDFRETFSWEEFFKSDDMADEAEELFYWLLEKVPAFPEIFLLRDKETCYDTLLHFAVIRQQNYVFENIVAKNRDLVNTRDFSGGSVIWTALFSSQYILNRDFQPDDFKYFNYVLSFSNNYKKLEGVSTNVDSYKCVDESWEKYVDYCEPDNRFNKDYNPEEDAVFLMVRALNFAIAQNYTIQEVIFTEEAQEELNKHLQSDIISDENQRPTFELYLERNRDLDTKLLLLFVGQGIKDCDFSCLCLDLLNEISAFVFKLYLNEPLKIMPSQLFFTQPVVKKTAEALCNALSGMTI